MTVSERAKPPKSRVGRSARTAPPILVRLLRNGIEESVHRGDIVEADVTGRILRQLGDAERVVTLRSTVKPFGAVALIEAGGVEAFGLEPDEIAILASSHSGEDIHVRTIQAMFRRAGVSQNFLACGNEDMPLDALTASRLARDGEKAGPVRHMCSGQHSVSLLLSRLHDWDLESYWQPEHPSQAAYRSAVARAFGTTPDRLVTAIDGCGVQTYAFPLREVAQAYAFLADPSAVPSSDPRASVAPALTIVRDAMLAEPEMIGGRHDRLDTSLMKANPASSSASPAWRPCAGWRSCQRPAAAASPAAGHPGWRSRSKMEMGTIAAPGPPPWRPFARRACSMASPFASCPAITGRPSSIRMDGSRPRRCPTSNSRPWASGSADPAVGGTLPTPPATRSDPPTRWLSPSIPIARSASAATPPSTR